MAYLNPAAGVAREALGGSGAPAAGTDEIQTLTIGGTPTGGTFRLGFAGFNTAPITWSNVNATLVAAIDAALEALGNIGTGGVTTAAGTLTAGIGTITITFGGPLAKRAVSTITVIENALTGTTPTLAVAKTTPGVSASGRDAGIGARYTDTATGKVYSKIDATTWQVVGAQT